MTFPVWYYVISGEPGGKPEIILPQGEGQTECIKTASYMRTLHMDILDDWRDEVVREGSRYTLTESGNKFEMSLSNTCISCHSNKKEFCDRCHDYLAVTPYCWECHLEPETMEKF